MRNLPLADHCIYATLILSSGVSADVGTPWNEATRRAAMFGEDSFKNTAVGVRLRLAKSPRYSLYFQGFLNAAVPGSELREHGILPITVRVRGEWE
jgi:hypothetical protein